MLELYHWEPNGASARVMLSLEEKGIGYASRFVDVLALEQYRPQFLKLDGGGEVPLLVHDGAVYTGASQICEYLEERFPGHALMPSDARGRWQVRVWQKLVDDALAPSVSEIAWEAYGAHGSSPLARGALDGDIERIGSAEKRAAWQAARAGYAEEQLAQDRGRIEAAVARMEAALARSHWLAGPAYTLADIAVFGYFKYLPALCPSAVSEAAAPRAMAWMRAVEGRPAVLRALDRAHAKDPYAVGAPGPEPIRWG